VTATGKTQSALSGERGPNRGGIKDGVKLSEKKQQKEKKKGRLLYVANHASRTKIKKEAKIEKTTQKTRQFGEKGSEDYSPAQLPEESI